MKLVYSDNTIETMLFGAPKFTVESIQLLPKDQLNETVVNEVEKVIFNPPATIVLFKDGTKVVVKTTKEDIFQPEIGFAMAMMKKIFGSRGRYKKWINSWRSEAQVQEDEDYDAFIEGLTRYNLL